MYFRALFSFLLFLGVLLPSVMALRVSVQVDVSDAPEASSLAQSASADLDSAEATPVEKGEGDSSLSLLRRRVDLLAREAPKSEHFPSIQRLARLGLDCLNKKISDQRCRTLGEQIKAFTQTAIDSKKIPSKEVVSSFLDQLLNSEAQLNDADEEMEEESMEEESEFEVDAARGNGYKPKWARVTLGVLYTVAAILGLILFLVWGTTLLGSFAVLMGTVGAAMAGIAGLFAVIAKFGN
jgi:hypothetical protein